MTSAFDLSAYLERIGYQDEPAPDLATLASIVLGHAQSIAFENLDPFLGRPVALDPASLQAKLVAGGRGGYCFEHNLLLAHALRAAGFRTTGLAARVLWKRPRGEPPPRTHMLLRVYVDEGAHLVDVGFGGLTLTGILRLDAYVAQTTPHERCSREFLRPQRHMAGASAIEAVRDRVSRLVERKVGSARQPDRCEQSPALIANRLRDLDSLGSELGELLLEVVAHEEELVFRFALGGMHGDLRRG